MDDPPFANLLAIMVIGVVSTAIGGEPASPPPLTEEQLNRRDHCSGYELAIERLIKRNLKVARFLRVAGIIRSACPPADQWPC